MAVIGRGVTLRGLYPEDFQYTFNVAGTYASRADIEGQAMCIDTSAANTVKPATDGALILGPLATYEDRKIEGIKVGTVSMKGGIVFNVDPTATAASPDETPDVGDYLVGAVDGTTSKAGYVRKATTTEVAEGKRNWMVVEVINSGAQVVAINV